MSDKYHFLFTSCPDSPPILLGIFPTLLDIKMYLGKNYDSGYYEHLAGEWKGMGPIPSMDTLRKVSEL